MWKTNQVRPVSTTDDLEMGVVVAEEQPRPFPMTGITLNGIQKFIESCGGRSALEGLTTTEVCVQFIVPLTSVKFISYCDFCAIGAVSNSLSEIGTANVFISHAWKYIFLNVIDSLIEYFKNEDSPTFLWFDLFSNNQNGLSKPPPFTWWCDVFMKAIKEIGFVVMVMEPWDNPIPLTRAWCLWEVYCTENTESKFEVAMSQTAQQQFLSTIVENSDSFTDMLNNVDVRKSEAFNPDDKQQIFDVINKSVGFQKLNQLVIDRMRRWVISSLKQQIDTIQLQSTDESSTIEMKQELQVKLLRFQLAYYDSLVKLRVYNTDLPASFDNELLSANTSLAVEYRYLRAKYHIYNNMRNYFRSQIAFGFYKSNLQGYETFKKDNNIAEVGVIAQLCINEANELIIEDSINAVKYNALILMAQREIARDSLQMDIILKGKMNIDIIKDCLNAHIKEYGAESRLTLECYSMFTSALRATGQYKPAKENCIIAVEGLQKLLGRSHPNTLNSMKILGELNYWLCQYNEAITILEECLSYCVEKFGVDGKLSAETLQLLQKAKQQNAGICAMFYAELINSLIMEIASKIVPVFFGFLWWRSDDSHPINYICFPFTAPVALFMAMMFVVTVVCGFPFTVFWLLIKVSATKCCATFTRQSRYSMLSQSCLTQQDASNRRCYIRVDNSCSTIATLMKLFSVVGVIIIVLKVLNIIGPKEDKSTDIFPTSFPTSAPF